MSAFELAMYFRIAEIASLADAGNRHDLSPVSRGQQVRDHDIVRRFAGAGSHENDVVVGLHTIQRVMSGCLGPHK